MTKGESLRDGHLIIIIVRARSIITIVISTIKGLLRRIMIGRRGEAIEARLSVSNTTNPCVHLTHLIKKIVKMTTKINSHV